MPAPFFFRTHGPFNFPVIAAIPGLAVLAICLCLLSLPGCGYRPLRVGSQATGGQTQIRLHLPIWQNHTNELGFESTMQAALADWFRESGHFRLVTRPQEADYVLRGEIRAAEHSGSAFGAFDQATGLKVVLKLAYTLREQKNNTECLRINLTREEPYPLGTDAVSTLSLEKAALSRLAAEIAEEVYVRLITFIPSAEQHPAAPEKEAAQ